MPSAWSSDVCSRSEEHTSELQSHDNLVCRLLLEKQKKIPHKPGPAPSAPTRGQACHRRPLGLSAARARERLRSRWVRLCCGGFPFFFFKDRATPEISPLPLHAALPV